MREQKDVVYKTMSEFRAGIVAELDAMFAADTHVHVIKRTNKYLTVKCKYKGCVFDLWYNEDKSPGKLGSNVKWCRNINLNHSIRSHADKTIDALLCQ